MIMMATVMFLVTVGWWLMPINLDWAFYVWAAFVVFFYWCEGIVKEHQ